MTRKPTAIVPKAYKPSSTVLVVRDGLVLVVERATGYGIPGGKAEADECPATTAARELLEETGLKVYGLRPLHEGSPDGEFWCSAYAAVEWTGEPRASAEGAVRWVTPAELANAPPFAEFNRAVLRAAGVTA